MLPPSPGAIDTMRQLADGRRLLQFGEGDVISVPGTPATRCTESWRAP
jgi:hypothetical protein